MSQSANLIIFQNTNDAVISNLPDFWPYITLVGLIFNIAGATLLAIIRTNWMKEKTERTVKGKNKSIQFGTMYLKRNGKISESDKSLNHEDSFVDLRDFIMCKFNRGDLHIPRNVESEVERFEFEKLVDDIPVGNITIVFKEEEGWGKTWEKALSMKDLEEEVDAKIKRDLEKAEDKQVQYSWEFLAIGFLLQATSLLFQHSILLPW